ncbi:capsular polysaccharide biosynthesis protein [Alphaproteobacteria bacterium KMM 3653]|uniref:Capsular polysaccharide biosynthesis protein n=1 Tax=Harenicola maris TaxID=2841044 RepID=A0AAP2G9B3_9RHOB|nr:capsular polysaccharide biosynthesis protein [Harenicola maris]
MTGTPDTETAAAGETSRRLYVYNGGFLTNGRVRRILALAGWRVSLGAPGEGDWVGVWGRSPTSPRGEAMAERRSAPVLRVEDALLRSVKLGRDGDAPLGLALDKSGIYFDSSAPSDLETMLAKEALDDTALLDRARHAMARIKRLNLSKYNSFDPALDPPAPGYVLVIDQTEGDASVTHGNAGPGTFREMLAYAQIEHPGLRIVIKGHPETRAGHRPGYFGPEHCDERTQLLTDPVSPWALLEGAVAVYTVTSGMGFEAIIAGHKPRVFGQPFYGGWGLTADENPVPRRERRLTRAQLFAAAMIRYPTWYDPYQDRLCELEEVIDILEAQTRTYRSDRQGFTATGMRLWKRGPLQRVFGAEIPLLFQDDPVKAAALGRPVLAWAGKVTEALEAETAKANLPLLRVEDGFLRSRGLGANLIPPLSLCTDDLGIYYDPQRPSRLERLITASTQLPQDARHRAEALIARLCAAGLSKYNLGGAAPDLPEGHRILVPGQVEDDASIRCGCSAVASNAALLQAARAANPDAVILYKPHPDVEAGLRDGAVPEEVLQKTADAVLHHADPLHLIEACDEVWTMTSLLGFEALLRGKPVTCLGAPFYAGWGLTRDLGDPPARRSARPDITALAHAALIDYPRYFDPVTNLPCPVEVVVDRLENGPLPKPGPMNRTVAKLQGWLAGFAPLWRR